jgi:uncharacterized coiled-coil DUF342 family protein
MTSENSSWAEYSKLVLKELATLATSIQQLQQQIVELKQEVVELRAKEDKVHELVKWKERVDEIASPTQLQVLKVEVEQLKLFKTKAITIFMVVQFAMGLALGLLKFI